MIHGPSFKAGLAAAADFLRNVEGIKSVFGPHLAEQVLRLKPSHRSTKKTRARSQSRATKAAKRETKKAARMDVRERVSARAGDLCESCGISLVAFGRPGHLDHFFGRARAESLETCWLLCAGCDEEKTQNDPSAAYWLEQFITHATRYGYRREAERACARLEGIIAIRRSNTTQEGEAT